MKPLLLLILTLLLVFGSASKADEPAPGGTTPRLEKRVTLRIGKSPLSEVVAELGRKAGVRLRAAAEVADEPAIVYAFDQPAGEVMRQLASLFDYRWRRTGEGENLRYELYQDQQARKKEDALREADR